jgi:hypothetical protein
MTKDPKIVRCIVCESEFSGKEIEGVDRCPNCGDDSVPCSIDQDTTIKINWQELRILAVWAVNWAELRCGTRDQECIHKIVDRLQLQKPDESFGSLIVEEEVQQIADTFNRNVELVDPTGNKKVIKPTLKN